MAYPGRRIAIASVAPNGQNIGSPPGRVESWRGSSRPYQVTAYDPTSRSLLDSGGNITVGSLGDPEANPDGSVDIYFGPTDAPEGREKNWIKTDPAEGFFVVFRFYGPTEGYIDKTWVLNDFERTP